MCAINEKKEKSADEGNIEHTKKLNLSDKTLHVIYHMHANGALMTEEGN